MNLFLPRNWGWMKTDTANEDFFNYLFQKTESELLQTKVTDNKLEVYVEIPGVKKENLEINTENDIVVINGVSEIGGSKKNVSKKIRVNKGYDLKKVQAKLIDGILTLTFEKKEKSKAVKILIE